MKITFTLILSLFISFSYSQNTLEKNIDKDLLQTWLEFKQAVQSSNKNQIKKISADTISCSICLDNTTEEQFKIEELKNNDSNWYKIIYEKLIYIPIDTFYEKDFNLIFTKDIIKRMNDSTKLLITKMEQDPKNQLYKETIYRILVTIIDPSDKCEGAQLLIDFKKTKKGYKFYTVETVP